jgi:putative nucleotidyltransferase with HDIG domain
MKDRLLNLIPEFGLIGDPVLRDKTLQVWVVAMERGHWTPATLVQMPFTLLINPCPANIVEHVRAVTLTALRAAEVFERVYGTRVPIDHDLLVAGALLHDVGKLLEYEHRPDGTTAQTRYGRLVRHPFSGAALAAEFGLPEDIVHMIATHAGEGDKVKRTPEATLINKADFMSFECLRDLQSSKEMAGRLG